jgi:hypothetical protein
MRGPNALLMAYIGISIVVGMRNVILVSVRSGKRYRNIGASKAKWVLGSVVGLASIAI